LIVYKLKENVTSDLVIKKTLVKSEAFLSKSK